MVRGGVIELYERKDRHQKVMPAYECFEERREFL